MNLHKAETHIKCQELMNRWFRKDQVADLRGGKGVDGNSGTDGISKAWVATEFLLRLVEISWAPAPLCRSAGMLYKRL